MITTIENLPKDVIGFRASGNIEAKDYQEIVVPKVEKYLQTHQNIRMVYQLDDDSASYTLGGMYEDAKLGLSHITSWHRVAVVTDKKWLEKSTDIMSKLFPGDLKSFHTEEFEKAVEWAANTD